MPAQNYAYVANAGDNTVSMYTLATPGNWVANTPATIAAGHVPLGVAVDPLSRFVYVANSGDQKVNDGGISIYKIDPATGLLAPTNPAMITAGYGSQAITIDASGRFAYVVDTGDDTISMFAIDGASGLLTPLSPATVPTFGAQPLTLVLHPNGHFAYSAAALGVIAMFKVDANTGVLTANTPNVINQGGAQFLDSAIDPGGHFLFVPDFATNRVYIYAIDAATGLLSPAATPSVAVGVGPASVAIDATSHFVYVGNRTDTATQRSSISQFLLNPATGGLTPMSTPTVLAPGVPYRIVLDKTGKFAYVSLQGAGGVGIFAIDANGALTPYSGVLAGHTPTGIGIAAP